ncbi:MAG: methyltransferase [Gammaproteobacteria bacterium]|nr:methyltransferase [Gammaproteobacteria bacterium]
MSTEAIEKLRKDIVFREQLREQTLTFHSTWGLFSPREIDEGSRLLLSHIDVNPTDDCLDLGCGYGPIGLTLARLAPQGHTTLVDKDFVAIEYSRKNIETNQIANAEALLSNGFSAIRDRRFDVIASNIPAKVGNELMGLFFYDAYMQLRAGGRLYVVTINGLRDYIKRVFKEQFGNYAKLKQGKNYTVAMATKQN